MSRHSDIMVSYLFSMVTLWCFVFRRRICTIYNFIIQPVNSRNKSVLVITVWKVSFN
jgi:hypothetical protein